MVKNQVDRPATKTDNRAKVMTVACKLFVANDYDKVSIRAIATQENLDPGLIRSYFKSKLGLFKTMLKETSAPLLAQFNAVDSQLNKATPYLVMQTYYRIMSQNPDFPKLVYRIASMQPTKLNQELKNILKDILQPKNLNLFSRLKDNGILDNNVDPKCAYLSFFSMMIFPFLIPDLFKSAMDISITPEFMEHLAEQNNPLLHQAEKTPTRTI
ncbi:TetR/AcrR family transcriptional regulator [Psychromonas sp. MB-3u-54]|uniref:TetR/AcrR family transcriptional regulator n=1 Tax=Psychromonas sp. MB-3u-54 TaxID=2058319 RepID=UPI000C336041|nr:TetR/AcrR family transcriptional regulator [Psychromonas sp. MB-3u-54]PKH04475.1 TetR/AcrR family transcriptional regulator [Psychromonas sp. MB-3u-54]